MQFSNFDQKVMRYILLLTVVAIVVMNLSTIFGWIGTLLGAMNVIFIGALLAYAMNVILVRVEGVLQKKMTWKSKGILRSCSVLITVLLVALILYLLFVLVIPTVVDASEVLLKVIPPYLQNIQTFLEKFFEDNPEISQYIASYHVNWQDLIQKGIQVFTQGVGNVFETAFSALNIVLNSLFKALLAFILAIYLLMDKDRFVNLYYRLMRLYVPSRAYARITNALKIVHATFSAFIGGQCLEAVILGTLCAIGMMILRMPYPVMIGTLVGTINIIPMIGAYIGGAIGMFLVFTVNPMMSLGFLVYLCILQQIESNVIYPRVVGKSVGLPGIYVMMSVIVFGSLAGILGMLIGIPLIASIYKLVNIHLDHKEEEYEQFNNMKNVHHKQD